jgi:hypothetical protein
MAMARPKAVQIKAFPDAFGKLADVGVQAGLLEAREDADVTEDGSEEAHQMEQFERWWRERLVFLRGAGLQ